MRKRHTLLCGALVLFVSALAAAAGGAGQANKPPGGTPAAFPVTTDSAEVRKAFEGLLITGAGVSWKPRARRQNTIVRVPFTKQNGLIVVQATLGGKVLPCVLDTGDPLVRWPRRLRLAGKATGIRAQGTDAGGHGETHEMVLLSHVRIGGYELANVPSWAVGTPDDATPDEDAAPETIAGGVWRRYPVLGNVVFEQVALTIDYRRSELILRPKNANTAEPSRVPGMRTLPVQRVGPVFTTDTGAARGGFLVFAGSVNGQPVNFLLDTGLPFAPGIVLAPGKRALLGDARAASGGQEVRAVTGLGQVSAQRFTNVSWSLGNVPGKGEVIVPPQLAALGDDKTSIDALVGAYLLQAYRITIDYPRSRVLLEPYAATEAAATR